MSEAIFYYGVIALYIASAGCGIVYLFTKRLLSLTLARGLAIISTFLCITLLASIGLRESICPVITPMGLSVFFIVLMVLITLALDILFHLPLLTIFGMPLVSVIILFNYLIFAGGYPPQISPLRLAIVPFHITLILAGYVAFIIGFLSGIMFLLLDAQLKEKVLGGRFYRFSPPLATVDRINFYSLVWGFGLFTVGILLGFILIIQGSKANIIWENDPSVWLSVITWLIYLIALAFRLNKRFCEQRVAYLSILSACLVLLTYFGIGFLGKGFHRF